jgi:hypothetical protein
MKNAGRDKAEEGVVMEALLTTLILELLPCLAHKMMPQISHVHLGMYLVKAQTQMHRW